MFLAYINDHPEELSSQVRLFADDKAVYLTVGGSEDEKVLQKDLDQTFYVGEPDGHGIQPLEVPSGAGDNCQGSN